MRHNRTKTRRSNTSKYLQIIGIIVLLCVLSISIGFFGTKYFLIPRYFTNQNDDSSKKAAAKNIDKKPQENIKDKAPASDKANGTTDTKETVDANKEQTSKKKAYSFEIPSLSIYNIQVGSFNERTHAQSQIKNLNDKGLGGYIVESDRFRVVVMSFTERSSAEKFRDSIKDLYSDAFVSPIKLPIREISYGEQGKAYGEIASKEINELKKYYENFSAFIASNDISKVESNKIVEFIDSEVGRLDGVIKALSAASPSEDFTSFNTKLTNIVKTSRAKLVEIKESNVANRTKLLEAFMESLNSYDDII